MIQMIEEKIYWAPLIRLERPRNLEVLIVDEKGNPLPRVECIIEFENGREMTVTTDENGILKIEKVSGDHVKIKLKDGGILLYGGRENEELES